MSLLSDTHSDRLAARVTELLGRADGAEGAAGAAGFRETEERALRLKTDFYDQFG
ncbi:hypothetical protein ACIQV3_31615 [Streptomyces sp. NPDC099050]|uniref:hypothetical protein n=1 Tax=Streptomyces sp. NPDC099050 TaxID=3366100 RepID=UPI003829BC33